MIHDALDSLGFTNVGGEAIHADVKIHPDALSHRLNLKHGETPEVIVTVNLSEEKPWPDTSSTKPAKE